MTERWKIVGALAIVYVVWGSTFLAIRVAVASIPPFLMAALRFLPAGFFLYGYGCWTSKEPVTRRQWADAFVIGSLLLLTGNGIVVWAEQRVPSGLAALMVGTVPLWMVGLPALLSRAHRPSPRKLAGLCLGFAGVFLLIPLPQHHVWMGDVGPYLGIWIASLSWAAGTLYSKRAMRPSSTALAAGTEMIAGGVLLLILSLLNHETQRLTLHAVPPQAWFALIYLSVFGSIVAFSAYRWLSDRITTAQLSTYAYVNPVVAVFLGWLFLGEPVTARLLMAAAIVLGSVALISYERPTKTT